MNLTHRTAGFDPGLAKEVAAATAQQRVECGDARTTDMVAIHQAVCETHERVLLASAALREVADRLYGELPPVPQGAERTGQDRGQGSGQYGEVADRLVDLGRMLDVLDMQVRRFTRLA